MKIIHIERNSLAEELGLQVGDDVIAINGREVKDEIDFQFWAAEDQVLLQIRRQDEVLEFEIEGGFDGPFGAEFEPMKCKWCGNKCVFCFVDQNPKGLRSSLYFKDEDFRLSFLYGNYVTLTNVSPKDLRRIVTQRLSPLYVSVHAVDTEVRKRLLGIRGNDKLLDKIKFLTDNGIEIHAQIVLCPGWNDGPYLDQTVDELSTFYPMVRTVAIVPVGVTKHRRNLPELRPIDGEYAKKIIEWDTKKSKHFLQQKGSYFIYLADEFYLQAGRPFPPAERYEDFAQIENGVGLTRDFLDTFEAEKDEFPQSLPDVKLTIVTGTLAAPVLQKNVLPTLRAIEGLQVDLQIIRNKFYGGNVGVSGLLVGQDIAEQLQSRPLGDLVAIPPNCLNDDGIFLDDWTIGRLEKLLQRPVLRPEFGFAEILDKLYEFELK